MCPMGSNHSTREEELVQTKCKDGKSMSHAAAEAGGAHPEVPWTRGGVRSLPEHEAQGFAHER